MSGHTPGPWSLTTVSTSCGSCHKIGPFPSAGHRREVYACVYADGIRIGFDEKLAVAQELLANARLIAAAPELLEAVRAAEALAVCCMAVDGYSRQELHDLGWGTVDTFRAAIAAATGETK